MGLLEAACPAVHFRASYRGLSALEGLLWGRRLRCCHGRKTLPVLRKELPGEEGSEKEP